MDCNRIDNKALKKLMQNLRVEKTDMHRKQQEQYYRLKANLDALNYNPELDSPTFNDIFNN